MCFRGDAIFSNKNYMCVCLLAMTAFRALGKISVSHGSKSNTCHNFMLLGVLFCGETLTSKLYGKKVLFSLYHYRVTSNASPCEYQELEMRHILLFYFRSLSEGNQERASDWRRSVAWQSEGSHVKKCPKTDTSSLFSTF